MNLSPSAYNCISMHQETMAVQVRGLIVMAHSVHNCSVFYIISKFADTQNHLNLFGKPTSATECSLIFEQNQDVKIKIWPGV